MNNPACSTCSHFDPGERICIFDGAYAGGDSTCANYKRASDPFLGCEDVRFFKKAPDYWRGGCAVDLALAFIVMAAFIALCFVILLGGAQ